MKARILIAILVAAIAVAGAVWFVHWMRYRDERQIQKALDTVVAQVSKNGAEGDLVALAKAAKVASCFSETPDIAPPPPINRRIQDLDVLRGIVHQARLSLERIDIRLLERTLEIDKERGTATMEVTAQVRVDYAGQRGDEVYRFTLGWVREDGRWRIRTVRTADTIQAPPGFPSI